VNRSASVPPWVAPRDLFLLGYLPAMALLAWAVPEALWAPICATAPRLAAAIRRKRSSDTPHVEDLLSGRPLAGQAERIVLGVAANYHEARLQALRWYRFDSWRPSITLDGREHVQDALDAGSGAVLWVAPFVFSDLVTKMVLHRAGFPVTHLSRPGHGFSQSRLGMRFLNPLWTSIERHYLAGRLVMTPEGTVGALAELVRRVRQKQLISITVGAQGQRRHVAPFFNGVRAVAAGAPILAHRGGAPLLPVFTVRHADGTFHTTIEAPLCRPADLDIETVLAEQVTYVVRLLESYVARWPDQYGGWAPSCPEEVLGRGAALPQKYA